MLMFEAHRGEQLMLSEIPPEKQKEIAKGILDVDVAAVKAIAALFKGLPVSKDAEVHSCLLRVHPLAKSDRGS